MACGHETISERRSQAQTNAVGKYDRVHRLVKGILHEQLGKVGTRAERSRSQAEIDCAKRAVMSVQRLVARITDECARDSGQVDATIPLQHELRNQNVRETGAVEVVTELDTRVAFATDHALHLKGRVSQGRREQWILAGALK